MIQSEEKSFKQYIKNKSPIHVVFKVDGVYIYTVLDEKLNVKFENKAFNEQGCCYNVIKRKMKEFNLNINNIRTDSTIEDLICNLYVSFKLGWNIQFLSKEEYGELKIPVMLPLEQFDIESNSKEFEEFKIWRETKSMENLLKFINS